MKNRFLSFFRRYRFCLLLSVIMVLGIFVSTNNADLFEIGEGLIRLNFMQTYLIFGLPLYALMYGCVSYIKTKRIWIPQLILYLITCIFFFGFNLIVDKEFDAMENILIVSVCLVVVSLVGAFITSLFVPQKR